MLVTLYVYDIESYPNVFTVAIYRPSDHASWDFEISFRKNEGVQFFELLTAIKNSNGRMVGFNNVHFDYPVIHDLIKQGGHITALELYEKTYAIINSENRFAHVIWDSDRYVTQVDLFKIHHFDNMAKSTSLKILEFNMKSQSIQDLPFKPGRYLSSDEIDRLIPYNAHDVSETAKFLEETAPMLAFRDELTEKYDRDFTNHNDTKIGKDYFIMELERSGIPCYQHVDGKREPRQTVRSGIALKDVILPWVQFRQPEFQRILEWLQSQTITETKGIFKNLSCVIGGFQYHFGTGGIHGSVESQTVVSDDHYAIIDLDVASYYPNLAITNRLYPEHLGERFCEIYLDVYNQRKKFAKGTPENAMLKLALNGVFGDSNNQYSPFYDPAYTMAITINGQLLLCMLAEYLMTLSDLTIIQINTDGVTVRCPRDQIDRLMSTAQIWEQATGLELERADYSRMMIRDVNNYIAEYKNGDLKRKGAYCYGDELAWHQNHSAQIVAIAAEAALVQGVPIDQTVRTHTDIMDFMKRTKVPRSSRLHLEPGEQLQNVTRYYVSKGGGKLIKVMPPTPAQVRKDADAPERRIGIDVGWTVTPCNDLGDFNTRPIDIDHYIGQARKLVDPLIA